MAEHGTITRYKHPTRPCRCEPCKAAWSRYGKHRTRQKAYGRWQPYVDATPAREHLLRLKASGMGVRRVGELADIAHPVITRIRLGKTRQVRPETMERILAVQPGGVAAGAKVDATGSRRRLQALMAVGWSVQAVADASTVSKWTLYRCMREPQVFAGTAVAVREVYERMWDQAPPESTRFERTVAGRSRARAAAEGWPPPMAWDRIDDPAAEPSGAGYRSRGKLPALDELVWLHTEMRETIPALAMRFGVKEDAIRKGLERAS